MAKLNYGNATTSVTLYTTWRFPPTSRLLTLAKHTIYNGEAWKQSEQSSDHSKDANRNLNSPSLSVIQVNSSELKQRHFQINILSSIGRYSDYQPKLGTHSGHDNVLLTVTFCTFSHWQHSLAHGDPIWSVNHAIGTTTLSLSHYCTHKMRLTKRGLARNEFACKAWQTKTKLKNFTWNMLNVPFLCPHLTTNKSWIKFWGNIVPVTIKWFKLCIYAAWRPVEEKKTHCWRQ